MGKDLTRIENLQAHWNATGTRILKYSLEMFHSGLNEHKVIVAPDRIILENKMNMQNAKWAEKWAAAEQKRTLQEKKEASIEEALRRTEEAELAQKEIDDLLRSALHSSSRIDWEKLKRNDSFQEAMPTEPKKPLKEEYPHEPQKEEPAFSILDKLIRTKKEKAIQAAEHKYQRELSAWEDKKRAIDENNQKLQEAHKAAVDKWNSELEKWNMRKSAFLAEQEEYNHSIDRLKENYLAGNSEAVLEHCDLVLNSSKYPDSFPQNFELEYQPETKILIVEYELPGMAAYPRLKEVKYLSSKQTLKESFLSEPQISKFFDDATYKIALRTIHELFESDLASAIEYVSFNGWVKEINPATGIEQSNCILSIQASKSDFEKIDLAQVVPKECFKGLKGVSASKLSALTPIQPIMAINREDGRFVDSYNVAERIDNSTNLAAMDWEDFEHLIRELFEKEFQSGGGEVRITQASRDGGVDAIAFDPDPIRGGKIVIQAKRYTNTVGVSAVRDLYGTVMNEGATKGILVSTADYGPDAYAFATGKPLTLLNGSNLLHLLNKHGTNAIIDIKEAKRLQKDNREKY